MLGELRRLKINLRLNLSSFEAVLVLVGWLGHLQHTILRRNHFSLHRINIHPRHVFLGLVVLVALANLHITGYYNVT